VSLGPYYGKQCPCVSLFSYGKKIKAGATNPWKKNHILAMILGGRLVLLNLESVYAFGAAGLFTCRIRFDTERNLGWVSCMHSCWDKTKIKLNAAPHHTT
jgi:hypothetical protein